MFGIARILKVAKVDVGDALVWFVHNPHADVTVLFILAIQGVPHNVVTGLGVKSADAKDLVAAALWRQPTTAATSWWPPQRGSAAISHVRYFR